MDGNLRNYLPELRTIWSALVRQDALPAKVDAIVIGGCTDQGLSDRAAELYRAGVSSRIIISGYQPKDLNVTKAEFLASRCIALGVPVEAIILEKEATNTGENILFTARALKSNGIEVSSVILVHKPYMSLRFLATAQAQWPQPQPKFYTTGQSIDFEEYVEGAGLEDVAWKMLGDLKRMKEYVSKGYQTPQYVPEPAYTAYNKLVAAGFAAR